MTPVAAVIGSRAAVELLFPKGTTSYFYSQNGDNSFSFAPPTSARIPPRAISIIIIAIAALRFFFLFFFGKVITDDIAGPVTVVIYGEKTP